MPAGVFCALLASASSLFKSVGPDTAHLLCLNFSAGVNAKWSDAVAPANIDSVACKIVVLIMNFRRYTLI